MIPRRDVFPHVIELNYQARRRLGCCVYLIYDEPDWMLLDIGYEDTVDEFIELIRQMDFLLANCKYLVASHADVDHVQGLAKLQGLLPNAITVGHPETIELLKGNDRISIYAEIPAQGISIDMPQVTFQQAVNEGSQLKLGSLTLEVWNTPGHTNSQLALKMGELLFSGDNLFRDGGVGNIDAHHGSDIPDFIESLKRIRDCDAKWLLPSHGPIFRKDPVMIQRTIDRLETYLHMSDFGTCATDWPLLEEWDQELLKGFDAEAAS